MILDDDRAPRQRRAAVLAASLVLASGPLLAIAACAASDETDGPRDDNTVVIPPADSGEEASLDAAVDGDAAAVPCAPGALCSMPTPLAFGAIASINGRSKNDVWASGTGGVLMHWDGQQWSALESDLYENVASIFLTADEMWGVAGTLALRRGLDPNSVRTARPPVTAGGLWRSLSSIAVLPNGDAYVSVAPGRNNSRTNYLAKLDFARAQLAYEPNAVHPVTDEPQTGLGAQALFLVPDKALWLVGDHAAVVRYPVSGMDDGGTSSSGDGGGAGTPDGGVPLLGRGVVVPVASQVNLVAAWGYGDDLWTAGYGGTILHFDGAAWHEENTGTTVALNAIYGLSPKDIWAAGDDGTALHFDGATWSRVDVGGYGGSFKAIWAAAPDDVWVGGEGGMFHWRGAR
ncbi:MAG: hypothetical protein K0S65_4711 [Labilithrix sp.]|nr:hypothetical protein [Labilithrix sp.]